MAEKDAIVDLLGVLAYAELCAFDRMTDDARMAPNLAARVEMSSMATVEFSHYQQLAERITALGADPAEAMVPFVAALETFHSLTEPQTWLEAVVKAYVGDGMAADFYREVAALVDAETGELIHHVLNDVGRAEFAVSEVRAATAAQPWVAGRLALWARRLVGEAISQTQHVLADRDSLMHLMVQSGGDLAGVAALLKRITDRHEERMRELGLDS